MNMIAADISIDNCYDVLEKSNSNIVWEILRQSDKFYQWEHYPKGDVYDNDTHSQYYYHAHDPETSERWEEHGHFHLFLRQAGMPTNAKPVEMPAAWQKPDNTDTISHLIAISMDKHGFPLKLFTVNRWVTGETWYAANDVIRFLEYFSINHAWPSWPTNIWLTQMVKVYKAQIIELIQERDNTFAAWQAAHPDANPYEDRQLEVLSSWDFPAV